MNQESNHQADAPNHRPNCRVLRTPAASTYVGLSSSTLEKLRITGGGPRFLRLGRAIGYDVQDLDAWIDTRRANGRYDGPSKELSDSAVLGGNRAERGHAIGAKGA